MARKIIWSFEAVSDLDALAEYIAKDSPFYAAAFIQEALEAGYSLFEFSERGRIVPELCHPNIREILVRDYRLIYHIQEASITILAFIHGARDLKNLWEREKRDPPFPCI